MRCAGLAGVILSAHLESGQPKAGEGYELDVIATALLGGTSLMGGRGRIYSTLVGALIIGVLNNGLVPMHVPFFYPLIVKGVVIMPRPASTGSRTADETESIDGGRFPNAQGNRPLSLCDMIRNTDLHGDDE